MKRALIVCPGRGSYGPTELGYLARPGRSAGQALIERADIMRGQYDLPAISAMDGAPRFDPESHLPARNASPLIFVCSAVDALLISEEFEVVAVAGNSMGWYTALHVAGALDFDHAFHLVQTMGLLQEEHARGGQIIYPVTDEQWRADAAATAAVDHVLAEINAEHGTTPIAFWSIRLGGYAVLAGSNEAIGLLEARLPPVKRGGRTYPLVLPGHAAYHTPLLAPASDRAVEQFSELPLQGPAVPLIDGRGHIFGPLLTDPVDLFRYTFVPQVTRTYDFTHSIRVGLREFGPDCVILLGPGEQLGGAIGQIICAERWQGIGDRVAFTERQQSDPLLLSMGRVDQFATVAGLGV
ncbi:MAG: ACP S-malonyltransferase [Phycisphaerae bacterium]